MGFEPTISAGERPAAAHLLRSWVQIPLGAWMFVSVVSVVCCQVKVSATSWSLVQSSPTECGASCVIQKPQEWGGHSPRWAAAPQEKNIYTTELSIFDTYKSDLVSLYSLFSECNTSFTMKWSQRKDSFRRKLNSGHCRQGGEYVSSSKRHLVNAPGEIP